jgi:putative intracellular protease/amidase
MKSENFDTVFYPGGHGPMWDLAESPVSIALLESFYNSGKPIALVCHSPGVLRHVVYQGEPLVKGKRVSGFTCFFLQQFSRLDRLSFPVPASWRPSLPLPGFRP